MVNKDTAVKIAKAAGGTLVLGALTAGGLYLGIKLADKLHPQDGLFTGFYPYACRAEETALIMEEFRAQWIG